jgi:hypothetical protein
MSASEMMRDLVQVLDAARAKLGDVRRETRFGDQAVSQAAKQDLQAARLLRDRALLATAGAAASSQCLAAVSDASLAAARLSAILERP